MILDGTANYVNYRQRQSLAKVLAQSAFLVASKRKAVPIKPVLRGCRAASAECSWLV